MNNLSAMRSPILVASDKPGDAALVKGLLDGEFVNVHGSTVADTAVADFDRVAPQVLVLVFDTLEKAERYTLGLYRHSRTIHARAPRVIALCSKDTVKQAYGMCCSGHFDDYVLFWPLAHDGLRLAMSIRIALRELAARDDDRPNSSEFALQARQLAEMEPLLERKMTQGGQQVEATGRMLAQAEASIDAAFDRFSHRLVRGALSDMVDVKNAEGLDRELAEMKARAIKQPLRAVRQSVSPLSQWANDLRKDMQPLVESVRSLGKLAERLRPVILVIDDDEVQLEIVGNILRAGHYLVVFATSGREAMMAMRTTQPDLILMDVVMPDEDGLQTTLQIKAVPQYARIPVIMVSGWSGGDVVRDSLKAGATDFIVKPVEPSALLAKIARALRSAIPSGI